MKLRRLREGTENVASSMSNLGSIDIGITIDKLVAGGTGGWQLAFPWFLGCFLSHCCMRLRCSFPPFLLLHWWGPIIIFIATIFTYLRHFLPQSLDTFVWPQLPCFPHYFSCRFPLIHLISVVIHVTFSHSYPTAHTTLGVLYTPPGCPVGLRQSSGHPPDSGHLYWTPLDVRWLSGDCPVIVQWLSGEVT